MAAHEIAVSDTGQPLGPLAERGWFLHYSEGTDSDATVRDLGKFGDRLGTRVAGRAGALEEVIEHYDHNLRRGPTLDPNLAKHPATGIRLSAEDKKALVAFLRTLTDEKFTKK